MDFIIFILNNTLIWGNGSANAIPTIRIMNAIDFLLVLEWI